MISLTRTLTTTCLLLAIALSQAAADPPAEKGKTITLEEAYDRTLATDQTISLAIVALQRAHLQPASAWVKMSPSVSASGSAGLRDRAGTGSDRTSASAGLNVEQPILDLSFAPALRRGKLAVVAAGMDYRRQIRATLFQLTEAYYDVLSQQKLVEVDREALRLAEEQVTLAEIRQKAGAVTPTDVLRAKVTVETARRTLIRDSSTLASMKNILGNILNLKPGTAFRLAEPPEHSGKIPGFDQLLYKALADREDLRSQNLVINQNEERIREVRGNYGPRVVIGADASSSEAGGNATGLENDLQGSISLRIPIFNAGQKQIDLREADLNVAQSKLDRDQLMKTIEQEVKDAWLEARTLTESLPGLRVQVATAEQSYQNVQTQYKEGEATPVDVSTALNELNTARKDLVLDTYNLQVALRRLDSVGGTFQNERVRKARGQ